MPKIVERGSCNQEGEGRRDYSSALEFALVVAASDSSTKSKNGADYVCDGVADEVEINAALNALPAGGGKVILREGTFTIAAPITFPADSITLEGQGRGTFIDGDGLATGEHAIVVSETDYCAIKNLAIQTEDGGGKTSHCIYLEYAGDYLTIDGVIIIDSDSDAINLYDAVHQLTIRNCVIEDADDRGIAVYNPIDSTITNNIIKSTGGRGISIYSSASGVTITNNVIIEVAVGDGIYITGGNWVVISNNYIHDILGTGYNGIYLEYCYWMIITDNSIYLVNQHGIICDYIYNSVIANNNIVSTTIGGGGHGIYLYDGSYACVIEGNCMGFIDEDGICLNDVSESSFIGNYVTKRATTGIHLEADVDDCLISNNIFYICTTAINIAAATCDNNIVKSNKIKDCTTGITDSGTNTMLAAYVVPFSDGSDPEDSGFLIDLADEYARAWMRLPAEVQQVVRMKIYARAGALSAAAMRLEINANGGADNEAYNTHATAAPNTPSTSSNFAADDVIFWTLTSAQIVALLGGDSVEVKVLHEAAGDGDCATNAYMRTVEIEYV